MSIQRFAGVLAFSMLLVAVPATAHDAPRKHTHTKTGRVVWTDTKPSGTDTQTTVATAERVEDEKPKAEEPAKTK